MNIIIPKSNDIDHMVLDFRDALEGTEMTYKPGEKNDLSNWVVVVPKIIMKDGDGDFTLENYVKIKKRFAEFMNDSHLANLIKSLKKGVKVIPMKNNTITVSAPLWKHSEQLITIIAKEPITALGETRKYLNIVDAGMCSLDYTHERDEEYVSGNLVELQYAGFTKQPINNEREKEDLGFQR